MKNNYTLFCNNSLCAVMGIRKCSHAKASSWLLTGSWSEVIVISQFLFQPGERSSHDLMLQSQVPVTPNISKNT